MSAVSPRWHRAADRAARDARRDRTAARMRPRRASLWPALGLLAALALGGVGWAARDGLALPPRLAIHGELRQMDRQRVVDALSPHLQRGFFAVDLQALEAAATSLPWVRNAQAGRVWRRWGVALRIVERVPLAHWRAGGLLDTEGELFYPAQATPLPLQLGGPPLRRAAVVDCYRKLQHLFSPDPAYRIVGLELSVQHGWQLAFAELDVMLGHAPLHSAQRLIALLRRGLLDRHPHPERIDMRYPNGLAIR